MTKIIYFNDSDESRDVVFEGKIIRIEKEQTVEFVSKDYGSVLVVEHNGLLHFGVTKATRSKVPENWAFEKGKTTTKRVSY